MNAAAIAIATTVAAQVSVAPLLAWHFGRLPAAGGIANLVVAPLAGVVMVGGMLTLGLASLSSAFGWAPATMRLLLDVILWTARTFADLPGASVGADPVSAAALVGLLAWLLSHHPRVRTAALAVTVLCAAMGTGRAVAGRAAACPGPEIRGLDIGGMAVLLRTSGGSVLYDGGPSGRGISDVLRDAGVGRVDVLITSHPHADHTQGLVEVVQRLRVGKVVGPPNMHWGPGGELVAAARDRGVPLEVWAAGEEEQVSPDLRLVVLAPERGPPPEQPSGEAIGLLNLVVRAHVGPITMLLAGDASGDGQRAVLGTDAPGLDADVMLAVHHGSADLDPDFVDAVSPDVTLVTVDPDNKHGHPREVALQMYAAHGTVVRTDTQGTLAVCVRDRGPEVTTQR